MIYLEKGRKPDYKAIPIDPGVYLFRAENNGLLYIGKAKCLKKRVSSYFTNKNHFPRIAAMVGQIRQIEWFVVDNEVEALLLESNLVKKLQPKYNIDLKDSKAFAYIKLSGEEFPRILTTRKVLQDGKYFGPYVDGAARNELMNLCVQLFKVRTCAVMPKRACLNYHIGICTAPCINNVTKEQYGLQVKGAEGFLKGERKGLVERLEKEMKGASAELNFEKALEKRMQIEAILHIEERQKVELVKNYDQDVVALVPNGDTCLIEMFTISKGVILGRREFRFDYYDGVFAEFVSRFYSTHKVPSEIIMNAPLWSSGSEKSAILGYLIALKGSKVKITLPKKGDKLGLVALAEKNAYINIGENSVLWEIRNALNLPQLPRIIECFDISNLGYDYNVGAMVRFVDSKPDTKGYRKFRIKSVEGKNDDFASMAEIVSRRYWGLQQEHAEFPGLIIIDGGLGQLNAALSQLKRLGLKIPVIALAKQNEEIYIPGRSDPLKFDKNGRMMLFIRSVRDAVHRFALGYNRKRRQMRMRDEFSKGAGSASEKQL